MAKAGAPWTQDEIERLAAVYATDTDKKIAQHYFPGRNARAIRYMARKLGLPKKQNQQETMWTKSEKKILAKYAGSMTTNEITTKFFQNRTSDAVETRIKKLNLRTRAKNPPWSDAESNFLQNHYADMPWADLINRLGRSQDSIKHQARIMGLHRPRGQNIPKSSGTRWTDSEIKILHDNAANMTPEEIQKAFLPKRSVLAVTTQMRNRGLYNPEPCKWTTKELQRLEALYPVMPVSELEKILHKSATAIRQKIWLLQMDHKIKTKGEQTT